MEDVLFKELQKGLEDVVQKLGKKYHVHTTNNNLEICRTSIFSKKGPGKVIMDIELHGNIIEATPQSSDWRLDKVTGYLQTFSDKYECKGVILKYEDRTISMPLPPNMYPYDNI